MLVQIREVVGLAQVSTPAFGAMEQRLCCVCGTCRVCDGGEGRVLENSHAVFPGYFGGPARARADARVCAAAVAAAGVSTAVRVVLASHARVYPWGRVDDACVDPAGDVWGARAGRGLWTRAFCCVLGRW